MKRWAWGLWVIALPVWASHLGGPPGDLLVLFDSGQTVSSAPYLKKINDAVAQKEAALAQARARWVTPDLSQIQLSERDLFPIRTTRLHPGAPVEVAVKGLTQPMFVIGMDARSLRWVAEQFEQLKQRGALGVVVAAEDPEAFARLRSDLLAQGVLLDLGFGDAMAESYGLSSYPALLVAP
ncbi:MAG: integrating conjugative element protein [Parvibaculaceae bacterium]